MQNFIDSLNLPPCKFYNMDGYSYAWRYMSDEDKMRYAREFLGISMDNEFNVLSQVIQANIALCFVKQCLIENVVII